MRFVKLPNGRSVSELCFGTLTMSPLQRNMPPAKGADLLMYAFERGVNFIDTAEIYANYEHIKPALAKYPETVVATKCYAYDERTAQASFEKAVASLGREYIDIFLLHEQESEHTLRGHAEAIKFFEKKQREGYIGELGISTHFVAGASAIVKHNELTILHPMMNKAGIGICDGTISDMEAAVSAAHDNGKFIYAMKPLGGGHLINNRSEAFRYMLSLPYIDCFAVGMQSFDEIDYNISVVSGHRISDELEQRTRQISRELLIHSWCEGCGVCVENCENKALSIIDGKANVDPMKCVFCGYCGAKCPQFCIKVI